MKKSLLLLISLLVLSSALFFVQKGRISSKETDNNAFNNKNEIQTIEASLPFEIDKLSLHDSKGVQFSIPFNSIPIYEAYLKEQSDQIIEVERTSSEFLDLKGPDGSNYVVVKYNCGVKLCSSLLIKISNDKSVIASIELGYGMLMDMKQSPNSENVVFRYGVNEGNLVIRNNLVLVNLDNMELLNTASEELSQEFIENATWPITEYKWVSDKTISIHVADIKDSEYDALLIWYNSSRKTKEVRIEL